MTGFARAASEQDGALLTWELKSVNGKSLEVRFRLPQGWDRIEAAARQAIGRRFGRGTIQAVLTAGRDGIATAAPVVNEELLNGLAALAQRLVQQFGTLPASADGLLALPGVLQNPAVAETEEARALGDRSALAVLEEALGGLETARRTEGEALRDILLRQVGVIEAITRRVEADPSREPKAVRARLAAQVQLLLDPQLGLDEGRLAAEAALLSLRADIREEIDRLKTHCAAARALLGGNGPAGRRLDFLGQEFNREANTLCAKSATPAVTAAGLELKAVVDQFREQVQNLE